MNLDELAAYRPTSSAQRRLQDEFLARADAPLPTARAAGPAHLTASAIVLAPGLTHVLLVLHGKVRRWMQPGGHVDDGDACLSAAALREAVEETGVPSLRLATPAPVHLERHPAPCGVQHHLDVRFLLLTDDRSGVVVSAESLDVAWWPVDALPEGAVQGLAELVRAGIAAATARRAAVE